MSGAPSHVAIIMDGNSRWAKKNKLAKINYNRTIGLSFENIKFLKKYDLDVEKIGQKISKIFLYKNDSKETFLKFDNNILIIF